MSVVRKVKLFVTCRLLDVDTFCIQSLNFDSSCYKDLTPLDQTSADLFKVKFNCI